MKKILVVFMILAVAGGVFAQEGTWSLSSAGGVGTRVNFDPDPKNDGDVALVRGTNYQRAYGQYTQIWGELGIGYTRGALGTRLMFSTEGYIIGRANINGENYNFAVESYLNEFLEQGAWGLNGGGEGMPSRKFVSRLWGSYSMLDGLAYVEVAYRGPDKSFWVSDSTAAIDDSNFQHPYSYALTQDAGTGAWKIAKTPQDRRYRVLSNNIGDYTHAAPSSAIFSDRNTFTKSDRADYLVGQISVGGFQAGLMVPHIFATTYTSSDNVNGWEGQTPTYTAFGGGKWQNGVQFVDDVLAQSIFGAKFNMHPVEVAAQVKLADYGVYFGAKFDAGPVTVGASFMGIMGKVPMGSAIADNTHPLLNYADEGFVPNAFGHIYDATVTKIGGRVDYSGGGFGAGVKAFYGKQGGKLGSRDADGNVTGLQLTSSYTVIGIEPSFFINAIPSHLNFSLNAGFYFETFTAPENTAGTPLRDLKQNYWAVQPAISWNFRGTGAVGATNYHGMNTGMFFRYRVVSNAVNALDIAFLFGL